MDKILHNLEVLHCDILDLKIYAKEAKEERREILEQIRLIHKIILRIGKRL